MGHETTYTVTLLKLDGQAIATYHDQDIADANFIIANALKQGYPIPEFDGMDHELNEYMDVRIEQQDNEKPEPCGHDAVLDSKLNNY